MRATLSHINFIFDISRSPICKQHCSYWATQASPGALAVFHKCLMWLWCIVWPKTRKLSNTCQRGRFQVSAVIPPPAEPGRVPGLAKLRIWTPNNTIWGQPSRTQTQNQLPWTCDAELSAEDQPRSQMEESERLGGLNSWRCYTKMSFPRPTAVYLKAREQTNGLCWMNEFLNGRKQTDYDTMQCETDAPCHWLVGWRVEVHMQRSETWC